MMELTWDEEPPKKFNGLYEGMEMPVYRDADFLANSDLQIFETNPSSYIWNKNAPRDTTKASTADFGTALHTALLERHLFHSTIKVTDIKGRFTDSFIKFQRQHSDKIVLTEAEHEQILLMSESALCDPMFKKAIQSNGACEASIFVKDKRTGLDLKIRPDKIIERDGNGVIFGDVKSAASLDEWRIDKQWINPLFKFNYGFTAAYYMYVGSQHYGYEMQQYAFLVSSKSSLFGKYPASVFIITKDELIEYGFWQRMLDALDDFAKRKKSGNFVSFEKFPKFYIYNDSDDVEVTYEGE